MPGSNMLEPPFWGLLVETVRLNLADAYCGLRGHNTRIITAKVYCVCCEMWL